MEALRELLIGRNDDVNLDRAALELATIEYPGLDVGGFVSLLDSYAVELATRMSGRTQGARFVLAANRYLFGELGFAGNQKNYYDPRNSCLNEVLASRQGIPITLSVVYMEIARRLAKPVYGIGLPGHFVIEYDDGAFRTFLDPFHGGRLLDAAGCLALVRNVTGARVPADPALLARAGKRQILLRMLHNLRNAYDVRGSYGKAAQVVKLLLEADPDSAHRPELERRLRDLNRHRARLN